MAERSHATILRLIDDADAARTTLMRITASASGPSIDPVAPTHRVVARRPPALPQGSNGSFLAEN